MTPLKQTTTFIFASSLTFLFAVPKVSGLPRARCPHHPSTLQHSLLHCPDDSPQFSRKSNFRPVNCSYKGHSTLKASHFKAQLCKSILHIIPESKCNCSTPLSYKPLVHHVPQHEIIRFRITS